MKQRNYLLSSGYHMNFVFNLRPTIRKLSLIIVILFAIPQSVFARIELNVTRVGFSTLNSASVVRSGAWVPVIVDIALIDQPAFDGVVRIAQFDVDGDECFDSVEVHLREDTGGTQRVYLYTPSNPTKNEGRYRVELLNMDMEAIEVVTDGELRYVAEPSQSPEVIHDNEVLLLSVSTGTIGHIKDLLDVSEDKIFTRPIRIAHMSTADLPMLWIGLEMVDFIVWDDANPDELNPMQIDALLLWVRHGGILLIASSRTAGALSMNSGIEKILPVQIGELVSVNNLPNMRESLLGEPIVEAGRISLLDDETKDDWFQQPFLSPVPVVRCELYEHATSIVHEKSIDSPIISRTSLGRGTVIFSGVTLKDLFSGDGEPADFFQNIFSLNVVADQKSMDVRRISLFNNILNAVSFSTSSSLYLLIAFVFSIGYLVTATGGTWWILGKRGWRKHSWTAFAAVAVIASTLSVIIVNAVQGFGATLHQIAIVDVQTDDPYGQATVFFGVKVSSDRVMDFWLPSDPISASEPIASTCSLKPFPTSNEMNEVNSSFADPQPYRLVPASAVVGHVRLRSTLKRFEGRWEGPLGGTFSGSIAIKNRMITEDSYVINDLGVDLHDCCLIQTDLDFSSKNKGFRNEGIYVYEIGDLPAEKSRVLLAPKCYKIDRTKPTNIPDRPSLATAQSAWSQPFQSILSGQSFFSDNKIGIALGEEHKALLLISTLGEFDPEQHAGKMQRFMGISTWSHDRLRQLDMQREFRRDTVILIGFANDPGPMRLFRRSGDRPYRILKPDMRKSWSMVRIRIPVTLLDSSGEIETRN